jgi:hypothetical protein
MKSLSRNRVGGKWVEPGRVFENINPVNGSKAWRAGSRTRP